MIYCGAYLHPSLIIALSRIGQQVGDFDGGLLDGGDDLLYLGRRKAGGGAGDAETGHHQTGIVVNRRGHAAGAQLVLFGVQRVALRRNSFPENI